MNRQFINEGKGENAVSFDMKGLSTGTYFVKIITDNNEVVRVIEKK